MEIVMHPLPGATEPVQFVLGLGYVRRIEQVPTTRPLVGEPPESRRDSIRCMRSDSESDAFARRRIDLACGHRTIYSGLQGVHPRAPGLPGGMSIALIQAKELETDQAPHAGFHQGQCRKAGKRAIHKAGRAKRQGLSSTRQGARR